MPDISAMLGEQPLLDENDPSNQLDRQEPTDIDIGDLGDQEQPGGDLSGQEPEQPKNKRVPLSALQEERTKRQALEESLAQHAAERAVLNDRLMRLLEAQQQAQQQPPQEQEQPAPIFAEDPEGYVNWLAGQFDKRLQAQEQYYQQQMGQSQQQNQQHQLVRQVAQQESQFRATTPDYDAAQQHFMAVKTNEYSSYGLDPVSVQQQIARDLQGIAAFALQNGKNTAQLVYNAATSMGYKKAAPQQPKGQQPKAPTSLSALHGATGDPTDQDDSLTLDKLAQMDDKQFDALWNQMSRGNKQRPKY